TSFFVTNNNKIRFQSRGFNEVITYNLVSRSTLDAEGREQVVRLRNALSEEQEYLRPGLAGGLLNSLSYNLNRRNRDVRLFEVGHVFGKNYSEGSELALIATGRFRDDWQVKDDFDFFYMKGAVKALVNQLGVEEVSFSPCEQNVLLETTQAAKVICDGKEVGTLGKINSSVLSRFEIKNATVFYAQLSLDSLCDLKRERKMFKPLSIYPSSERDLSLVAKKGVSYGEIADIIRREAGQYSISVKLIDIYRGQQIQKGAVGLTISFELSLSERTLTEEEVATVQKEIIKSLKSELEIEIR
ncbi:hypothetical protein ACFL96_19120, partial [Thermoproteota archaeon]